MYKEKVDEILLINHYLSIFKIKNPESKTVKIIQKYLSKRIGQILN